MLSNIYLFLDVDGVLNNYHSQTLLDDYNMQCFKELINQLDNVHIVITSSWRLFDEALADLKEAFIQHEIPLWDGITSKDRKLHREQQVLLYMQEHNIKEEDIVILDDIYFFKKLKHRFINTSMQKGFIKEDIERVLQLVNGGK